MESQEDDTTTENEEKIEDEIEITLEPGERRYRLVKGACMVQLWVIMGMTGSIVGPTLIDLTHLVGVNYEQISHVFVARSAGIMVGSVAAGVLSDRFQRHMDAFLSLDLALLAAGTAVVPWLPSLLTMGVAFFIQGVAHGALSATGNALILLLWVKGAAGPIHLLHMGYGLGTMVAPLVAAPFLPPEIYNTTSIPHPASISATLGPATDNSTTALRHSLAIPYGITGACAFVPAIIFLIFYCIPYPTFMRRRLTPKTLVQIISPASCSGGQTSLGVFTIVSIFLIYVGLVGKDVSLNTFLFTIAVEDKHVQMSKSNAAYLNTAFYGSYAFGRLVASLLSKWVPIQPLLFAEVILNAVTAGAMVFYGLKSPLSLWVFSVLFGFLCGPIYPGGIAWMNQYIEVTAVVVAVLDLGVGVASLIFPWAAGYLYQYSGAIYVIILSLGCALFLLVVLSVAQVVLSCNKKTQQRVASRAEDTVDETSPLIN